MLNSISFFIMCLFSICFPEITRIIQHYWMSQFLSELLIIKRPGNSKAQTSIRHGVSWNHEVSIIHETAVYMFHD